MPAPRRRDEGGCACSSPTVSAILGSNTRRDPNRLPSFACYGTPERLAITHSEIRRPIVSPVATLRGLFTPYSHKTTEFIVFASRYDSSAL